MLSIPRSSQDRNGNLPNLSFGSKARLSPRTRIIGKGNRKKFPVPIWQESRSLSRKLPQQREKRTGHSGRHPRLRKRPKPIPASCSRPVPCACTFPKASSSRHAKPDCRNCNFFTKANYTRTGRILWYCCHALRQAIRGKETGWPPALRTGIRTGQDAAALQKTCEFRLCFLKKAAFSPC